MNALPVNNRFISGVETKSERFCNKLQPYMSLFGGSYLEEWERTCLKSSASDELEGVTARTYIGMIADCEDDVLSAWVKLFCVRALIQELEQIPVDSNNDLTGPWIVKTGVAELYRVFPAHTTRVEIAQWLESIFDVSIAIRQRDGALNVCR